ncbi:MAG: IPTL-CTERM sorting domain-containing protein [Ignavibacteria bacterium]|nr:IPTL-CTERM sorting domain-containing protein [Ignavibacteria bacterium]
MKPEGNKFDNVVVIGEASPPPPIGVPALNPWGVLLASVLLVGTGIAMVRKNALRG